MAEDPLMTPDEVADILRVSRETVLNLANAGELRGMKVGSLWRFTREALRDYLAQAAQDDEEYEDEEEDDDGDDV